MSRKSARLDGSGFLQKPPEVFSAVMPPGRRLHAAALYLQRLQKPHAAELLRLYEENRFSLERWLQPLPARLTRLQMQDLIAEDHKYARQGSRLDLGIFLNAGEQMVGRIALHTVDYGIQRSAGLSYWISHEHSRSGLMTMSLATLTAFAFEEACLHRLWLQIVSDNLASLKLAEKLGFSRDGLMRKALFINGCWQDTVLLSLLESEYDEMADNWIEKGWLGFSAAT
ncbi:MAG TPA: hypothetical protein DCG57_01080 [Candidatus Riflebacteria bacterium]|jgi:RimJ/RimL family protein N-acetyltransferase|nr:hypothetical protein [Candidatus Riflebacteria bacterium]